LTKIKLFNFIALLSSSYLCVVWFLYCYQDPNRHCMIQLSQVLLLLKNFIEAKTIKQDCKYLQASTSVTFKKIPRDSSNTHAGNDEQIQGTNQRVSNICRITSSSALVSGQLRRNKVSAINKL